MRSWTLLGALTLFPLLACSSQPSPSGPAADAGPLDSGASADADAATPTDGDPGVKVSGDDLVLPASALGERYVLVSTAIFAKWNAECGAPPTGYAPGPPGDVPDTCYFQIIPMASRIVAFSKQAAELVMEERTEGEPAAELGRFAILGETDAGIRFSLNLAQVPVKVNVFQKTPAKLPAAIPILEAKVKARVREGWAAVQQDGLLPLASPALPARIKYGLQRYRPNPAFKPVTQEDGARRFFENNRPAPRPIARYDFSGDRRVAIRSVGVPAELRASADKGLQIAVDYWNRVFRAASGSPTRVFFEVSPDQGDAFAHDPGFKTVQWMTSPQNGTSTGVFQTDPVTGQTFFGNAYISSGFFGAGKAVGTRFYAETMKATAPAAAVDKFVEDYIAETVTHEIGHTLGLQHNFEASNVSKGKSPADLTPLAAAYFGGKDLPDAVSSSVMEYLPIPLAGVLGHRLRTAVLPYDLFAVAQAYFPETPLPSLAATFGQPFTDATKAAYCNDDDMSKSTCAQFDHPLCKFVGAYCFTETL